MIVRAPSLTVIQNGKDGEHEPRDLFGRAVAPPVQAGFLKVENRLVLEVDPSAVDAAIDYLLRARSRWSSRYNSLFDWPDSRASRLRASFSSRFNSD